MKIWACTWCGQPVGHEPQTDELWECPECGTAGASQMSPQEIETLRGWYNARKRADKGA